MTKKSLINSIKKLSKYKDGWDSYVAPAPSKESIKTALKYVDGLTKFDLSPKPFASADGGSVFSFVGDDDRRACIEILNEEYSEEEPYKEWMIFYHYNPNARVISVPIFEEYRLAYLEALDIFLKGKTKWKKFEDQYWQSESSIQTT